MHDHWAGLIAAIFGKILISRKKLTLHRQHGNNDTGIKPKTLLKDFQRIFQSNLKNSESDPYKILGVNRSSTDNEIRKKWIKLNKEHHPDNLIAKGMPKEFIKQSNKELAAINIAYDKIKEIRGIS